MRDYEYTEMRIFDLFYPGEVSPWDEITRLVVYQEDQGPMTPTSRICSTYIDPTHPDSLKSYARVASMSLLPTDQYFSHNDPAADEHYVVFANKLRDNGILGVFMIIDRRDQTGAYLSTDTIGNLVSDTLELKMIYGGSDLQPSHPTWPLIWRNCYSLPRGVSIIDIDLKVCKAPITQESDTAYDYRQISPDSLDEGDFVTILGLDQYNTKGRRRPDGALDDRLSVFRPDWGLLIFPARHPFDSDTVFVDADGIHTHELREHAPGLYDYTSMTERVTSSVYYLRLTVRQL
jgi:cell surface protein SprA